MKALIPVLLAFWFGAAVGWFSAPKQQIYILDRQHDFQGKL